MSAIIDGSAIASQIEQEIHAEISVLETRKPCLAVIQVGEHPPSQIYVKRKIQASAKAGIHSLKHHLSVDTPEDELLTLIAHLNNDSNVDGILVQLPLPAHMDPFKINLALDPSKDIDGFHPMNVGKMLIGEKTGFFSCTPLGIKVLLERSRVNVEGKHVIVLGRSNIVGKPIAAMLMQNSPGCNATVTVVHSRSRNVDELCSQGDILIAAIGQPRFVKKNMVKEGAVVIDVGINKIENKEKPRGYDLVGDVDFENVKEKSSLITPVPGGIGPMTIAMLLSNTLLSYKRRFHLS